MELKLEIRLETILILDWRLDKKLYLETRLEIRLSPIKERKNLKTLANSIESSMNFNMFPKTLAYSMRLEKITLKPLRIASSGGSKRDLAFRDIT